MITDYTGPSNNPDVFRYLKGETITGVMSDFRGTVLLIFSSGGGLELTPSGSYWVVQPHDVDQRVRERAAELAQAQAALGDVPK